MSEQMIPAEKPKPTYNFSDSRVVVHGVNGLYGCYQGDSNDLRYKLRGLPWTVKVPNNSSNQEIQKFTDRCDSTPAIVWIFRRIAQSFKRTFIGGSDNNWWEE